MNTEFATLADLKCSHVSYFSPLEVVDRGSETQLQVGKNLNCLNYLTSRCKG